MKKSPVDNIYLHFCRDVVRSGFEKLDIDKSRKRNSVMSRWLYYKLATEFVDAPYIDMASIENQDHAAVNHALSALDNEYVFTKTWQDYYQKCREIVLNKYPQLKEPGVKLKLIYKPVEPVEEEELVSNLKGFNKKLIVENRSIKQEKWQIERDKKILANLLYTKRGQVLYIIKEVIKRKTTFDPIKYPRKKDNSRAKWLFYYIAKKHLQISDKTLAIYVGLKDDSSIRKGLSEMQNPHAFPKEWKKYLISCQEECEKQINLRVYDSKNKSN